MLCVFSHKRIDGPLVCIFFICFKLIYSHILVLNMMKRGLSGLVYYLNSSL